MFFFTDSDVLERHKENITCLPCFTLFTLEVRNLGTWRTKCGQKECINHQIIDYVDSNCGQVHQLLSSLLKAVPFEKCTHNDNGTLRSNCNCTTKHFFLRTLKALSSRKILHSIISVRDCIVPMDKIWIKKFHAEWDLKGSRMFRFAIISNQCNHWWLWLLTFLFNLLSHWMIFDNLAQLTLAAVEAYVTWGLQFQWPTRHDDPYWRVGKCD